MAAKCVPPPNRVSTHPLTIYDVARRAGVSTASVSRVLNGHETPRPDTRARVLRAVRELGFVPDGAARALSSRLKEVVSVVVRRFGVEGGDEPEFEDERDNLAFIDMVNRGVEVAAQKYGYDLLLSSVEIGDRAPGGKIAKLAAKSDGIILHDRVMAPSGIVRLADRIPVVTLAATPTRASVNVGGDNVAGMRELARHLFGTHGYRSIAYVGGHPDSPDNVARLRAVREVASQYGVFVSAGPRWAGGSYSAAGGAQVIRRILREGAAPPRAVCCANDLSALGVIHELRQHGYDVPGDVAVTGFDDIPLARHVDPPLTTVRQPIRRLGAIAFDVLFSMIKGERPARRQILLPVVPVYRASCGCPAGTTPPPWRQDI